MAREKSEDLLGKKWGKPDLERNGLFSETEYITTGEKYDKEKGEVKGLGRQFQTAPPKPYFDNGFARVFEKEAISDMVSIQRKWQVSEKSKNISTNAFRPIGISKSSGKGSLYGTIEQQWPVMKPVDSSSFPEKLAAVQKDHKPNFQTKPSKKGGYGYANVIIGQPFEYKSDPYDRKHQKDLEENARNRKKMLNARPFVCASNQIDYFNPFAPLRIKVVERRGKASKTAIMIPFKPPSMLTGECINKYPAFEEPSDGQKKNEVLQMLEDEEQKKKYLGPIFRPSDKCALENARLDQEISDLLMKMSLIGRFNMENASSAACNAISLQMAVKDSPYFRESIEQFKSDVSEFCAWLDTVCKALKLYADELSTSTLVVAKLLLVPSGLSIGSTIENGIVRTLADAMQTVYSLQQKLVDDFLENLVLLTRFIREDARKMRENGRFFDKAIEKYDAAISKFCTLSKLKETSAWKEDAFQLFEMRKSYVHNALEYTFKIAQFKQTLELLVIEQLSNTMLAQTECAESCHEVFKGFKATLEAIKQNIQEGRSAQDKNSITENLRRKSLELSSLDRVKPSANNFIDTFSASNTLTIHHANSICRTLSSSHLHGVDSGTVVEREGYLFKRSYTTGIIVSVWTRKYFRIKENGFSWIMATKRKEKVQSEWCIPINVLLCNIRIWNKEDRRFTFEIYTSKKSFVLQAESEDDMNAWTLSMQNTKLKYAGSQSKPLEQVNPITTPVKNRWDSNSIVSDTEIDEQSESDEESAQPVIPESLIEGPPALPFIYTDPALEKRNVELHSLLKSVSADECVYNVYSVALQKDIAVHGKIYLTQNQLCFYSNILSFVTVLVVGLKDVTSITRKTTLLQSSIVIVTGDATHIFKTFLKDDIEAYESLRAMWVNSTGEQVFNYFNQKPVAAQEFFDSLRATRQHPGTPLKKSEQRSALDVLSPGTAEPSVIQDETATASTTDAPNTNPSILVNTTIADTTQPPVTFTPPLSAVSCGCEDHLEKKEYDVVISASAKFLFHLLFGDGSANCYEKFHAIAGHTNLNCGEWSLDEMPKRENKFTIPLNNPMVSAKETDCIEQQHLLKSDNFMYLISTKISSNYVVLLSSQTPNITYGDSFAVQTKICISWITKDSARLIISFGVKFFKSPMIKSMIRSQAMKSLQESTALLLSVIKSRTEKQDAGLLVKLDNNYNTAPKKKLPKTKKMKSRYLAMYRYVLWQARAITGMIPEVILLRTVLLSIGFLLCAQCFVGYSFGSNTTKVANQSFVYTRESCQQYWKHGTNDWVRQLKTKYKDAPNEVQMSSFLSQHFLISSKAQSELMDVSSGYNDTIAVDFSRPKLEKSKSFYTKEAHAAVYIKLFLAHRSTHNSRMNLLKTAQEIDAIELEIVEAEFANWEASQSSSKLIST